MGFEEAVEAIVSHTPVVGTVYGASRVIAGVIMKNPVESIKGEKAVIDSLKIPAIAATIVGTQNAPDEDNEWDHGDVADNAPGLRDSIESIWKWGK